MLLLLLQFISALGSEEPPPDCYNQGQLHIHFYCIVHQVALIIADILFTVSPENVTVNCSENMTAQLPCQYAYQGSDSTEIPWWTIGSTTYHTRLPGGHNYNISAKTLYVRNISIGQNNTIYVCEFHTQENGLLCAYRSEPIKLIIMCKGK